MVITDRRRCTLNTFKQTREFGKLAEVLVCIVIGRHFLPHAPNYPYIARVIETGSGWTSWSRVIPFESIYRSFFIM